MAGTGSPMIVDEGDG